MPRPGPRDCPDCGGPTTPIVYGLPGPELQRQAELGNVVLGGCCVSESNPTHHCPACDKEMHDTEPEPEYPGAFSYGHARGAEGRHAV